MEVALFIEVGDFYFGEVVVAIVKEIDVIAGSPGKLAGNGPRANNSPSIKALPILFASHVTLLMGMFSKILNLNMLDCIL